MFYSQTCLLKDKSRFILLRYICYIFCHRIQKACRMTNGANPVSYTHLDVYKRQLLGRPTEKEMEEIEEMIEENPQEDQLENPTQPERK